MADSKQQLALDSDELSDHKRTRSYQPYELAQFTDDMRFPGATPPPGSAHRHGEIEYLGNGVFGTHWFVEADQVVWHFVTTGAPTKEAILFVHGFPESWHAFHHQMAELSSDYYVIAVDQLGYGQSDKRLELDYSHSGVAQKLAHLMDVIGVEQFNLVSHDRGSVVADNLVGVEGMSERVLRYVRMQQTASEPHGYPRPPHHLFKDPDFLKNPDLIRSTYTSSYASVEFAEEVLDRLIWEFGFEGVAEAVAKTFDTSFDKELVIRKERLFPAMTMPVLFLQGDKDPGQRPEEYIRAPRAVKDGHLQFISANHFLHLEAPDEVTAAIRDFLNR